MYGPASIQIVKAWLAAKEAQRAEEAQREQRALDHETLRLAQEANRISAYANQLAARANHIAWFALVVALFAAELRDPTAAEESRDRRLMLVFEFHAAADRRGEVARFTPEYYETSAAIFTYLSPGLRFFHQGRFAGRKKRIPPHLIRAPRRSAQSVL